MRKLVIGDIHGGYKAMLQVLDRAKFNPQEDMLIGLGDYADGWPEVYEVIKYLKELPNFRGVIGNHDCFSDDTEALTDSGWKNYKDITLEDKILSLNTETKMLCWDKINEIIIKDVDGFLYNFSNNHIDMLITENHRILHQKRNGDVWGDYKYDTIKNLKGRIRIPTSGFCPKKGIDLSDSEIKFIAWILTDGGVAKTKNKNYYTIYQSKENTKKRIRDLLNELGYSFTETIRNRDIKEICEKELIEENLPQSEFRISSEDSQNIKKFFPEKYPFPNFLFDMNKEQFTVFINEVILGDGTFYNRQEDNKTAILYGTKEFLSNIQTLCIQNEKRAVITTDTRGTFRLNISDYTSTSFDVEDKIKEIPYKGIVWCLSVPQTNFVVRRNGKPFISGNCWLLDFLSYGYAPHIWLSQGGMESFKSYQGILNSDLSENHRKFLSSLPYYLEIDDKLFLHGGLYVSTTSGINIREQRIEDLIWNRELFQDIAYAVKYNSNPNLNISPYKEIYIGHTTTQMVQPDFTPVFGYNVYLLDQGAGWDGKLTVMDIDTKEWWQSNFVPELYPEVKGRR